MQAQHWKLGSAVAVMAMMAAGCGDGTGPRLGENNNPGGGTATLLVDAEIDGEDEGNGFITEFEASIRNASGQPVTGATVTFQNSSLGTVTLTETPLGSGEYYAIRPTFPSGEFRLDVVRGSDRVTGVVIQNPGMHTITAPARNATVSAGQPLTVTWTRPSKAQSAEVETENFGPVALEDVGTYTIAGTNNPANGDQRIRIFRRNEVDIAGGLPESDLTIEVRNSVEPVVVR